MRSLTLLRRFSLTGSQYKSNYSTTSSGRKYTTEHEWVQPLTEKTVRIGITDYAQKALGDLVYVELPKVGSIVKQKEMVGVVESVKGASDVYAPVSGTIIAVNESATSKPSILNKSPESDGWLCEVELSEGTEMSQLYDEEGYKKYCKGIPQ